ncbi:hypothetical protein CPC08DRAFT_338438 [Agrocybe pediades]|nr:hypothetical protein CPC08DRAFT_338438 [Agrocybe pediades]
MWIDETDRINDLLSKITEWFGQLWLLMQIEYIDMEAIEKAVVLGSGTVDTIKRCDMQIEFEYMDHAVRILDAEGETVYEQEYGSIDLTLAWMWRELLVLSASRNFPIHSILKNIDRFDLLEEVFKIMPQKYEGEEENEDEDEEWEREEEDFWHGH